MSKRSVWLTVGTVLLLALMMVLPALAQTDISDSVTTIPEPSTVLDYGMVPLPANTTAIEGCDYVYKVDLPVPPDASDTINAPTPYTGTITFKVSGNKVDGYTVEIEDTIAGYAAVIEQAYFGIGNDARKFTFDPAVTYASPLPAPNNSQGPGEISHTHFCFNFIEDAVESLTITKTADTTYTREHFWDIAKKVETEKGYEHEGLPKVWLYTDGSGDETATWTVDVTYDGYQDSAWNVYGDITIKNTGTLEAVITNVSDYLDNTSHEIAAEVNCGVVFPYALPVDSSLVCSYEAAMPNANAGTNTASVTTEKATYTGTKGFTFGDPATEINKTVNVKDISNHPDLGEQYLGSVTAPNGNTFTYTKYFAWADYGANGCGDFVYDNTAMIVETGQEAKATLKVNVQCYIYETAYGMGSNSTCFIPTFNNWGWTNPLGAEDQITLEMWAGAGQCDTSKGTYAGTVTVTATGGTVTFEYNLLPGFLLEETHSYAGPTMYPYVKQGKKWVYTVAPGAYYIAYPFTGGWAIAHAVVGIPDPNFGPGPGFTGDSNVTMPPLDM